MQPTSTNTAYQGINPFLFAMMDFVWDPRVILFELLGPPNNLTIFVWN